MDNAIRYTPPPQTCEFGENILHDNYSIVSIEFTGEGYDTSKVSSICPIPVSRYLRYTFYLNRHVQSNPQIPIQVFFTGLDGNTQAEFTVGIGDAFIPPEGVSEMMFTIESLPVEYREDLRIKAEPFEFNLSEEALQSRLAAPLGTIYFQSPEIPHIHFSYKDDLSFSDSTKRMLAEEMHQTQPSIYEVCFAEFNDAKKPTKKSVDKFKSFLGG